MRVVARSPEHPRQGSERCFSRSQGPCRQFPAHHLGSDGCGTDPGQRHLSSLQSDPWPWGPDKTDESALPGAFLSSMNHRFLAGGDAGTLFHQLFALLKSAPWRDVRHAMTFTWMLVGLLLTGQCQPAVWCSFRRFPCPAGAEPRTPIPARTRRPQHPQDSHLPPPPAAGTEHLERTTPDAGARYHPAVQHLVRHLRFAGVPRSCAARGMASHSPCQLHGDCP